MTIDQLLTLILLFQLKHFFVDFVFQTIEQVNTKGIFLHPVGVSHSLEHGIWTSFIFCFYTDIWTALLFGTVDLTLHYIIDFCKMRFGCRDTSEKLFWIQMGFDQFLHQLTYFGFLLFCYEVLAL